MTPTSETAATTPVVEIINPMEDSTNLSENLLPKEDQQEELVELDEPLFPETASEWARGEAQPPGCHDSIWGVLFLIQLCAVGVLAGLWGFPALRSIIRAAHEASKALTDDVVPSIHDAAAEFSSAALLLLLYTSLGALLVSAVGLWVMTRFSRFLVQLSVVFGVVVSTVSLVASIVTGFLPGVIIAGCWLAVGIGYAMVIWKRIPFAATNLETALTAVRTNWGMLGWSFGCGILGVVVTYVYLLSFVGVYWKVVLEKECNSTIPEHIINAAAAGSGGDDDDDDFCGDDDLTWLIVVVYLLSLFWTQQVIKNIHHVYVAGVVGTWWFVPEDAGAGCSPAIGASFQRATIQSFGSICLGSLLVGLLQLLESYVRSVRANARRGNVGILYCLLECLVHLLKELLEYFNKWAFVYVGLYGYSYWESGPKVMQLFRERGWTTILNEHLIYRVLQGMSLVIGILTGLVSMLAASSSESTNIYAAFALGLIVGSCLAQLVLSVVASAVDTVVVCFAEAPHEFQRHYPELSRKMNTAWIETFPDVYIIVVPAGAVV